MYMIFRFCYKMWAIPTGTSSAFKKKSGKESQFMFSHPELGLDPPIGSDRESGCDTRGGSSSSKRTRESQVDSVHGSTTRDRRQGATMT